MANLIEYIQGQIYENSTEDITGSIMQQVLTRMVSDEGVINVHTVSGQSPFAVYSNAQAARDAVPAGFKKLGLVITYKLAGGWFVDEYIGTATSGWSTASNWKCLGPISVSQNAQTGKTTITIGSESFDVATQPVSVSQNTPTGTNHTRISVGGNNYDVASVEDVSQLGQKLIKLVGFGDSGSAAGASQTGDVYYNYSSKKLMERNAVGGYSEIPFIPGAIYNCKDILYLWDGENMILADQGAWLGEHVFNIAVGTTSSLQVFWRTVVNKAVDTYYVHILSNTASFLSDSYVGFQIGSSYITMDYIGNGWFKSSNISGTVGGRLDFYIRGNQVSAAGNITAQIYFGYASELLEFENKLTSLSDSLPELLGGKVDKVQGKGLSTNDFSNEDKQKLDSIDPETIVSPEMVATIVNEYVDENSAGFVTQDKGVVAENSITYKLDSNILTDAILSLGTGWSGNLANGFTHASGNTGILSFDISSLVTRNDKLLITFNATNLSESADVYVSCGDSPFIKSYNGGTSILAGVKYDSGVLKITPESSYSGVITNLKCRKIDENGAEEYIFTSAYNVRTKLEEFIFGFWNVILGAGDTASKLQDGTRNIAIGGKALDSLLVGNRNIAIGTFAMPFVTKAENNVSIGSDSTYPTGGVVEGCVVVGKGSLSGKDLDYCVVIGHKAAGMWTTELDRTKITVVGAGAGVAAHDKDTLVGYQSGKNENGSQNTGVGYRALAIGDRSSVDISGSNLTCVGANASVANNDTAKAAENSTAIGAGATITKSNQVVLGNTSVEELVFGNKKIVFNQDGTVTWEQLT